MCKHVNYSAAYIPGFVPACCAAVGSDSDRSNRTKHTLEVTHYSDV